jgi:prepilin signal peptidase PulO-like enzyme (type II secretory pathway)
MQFELKNDGGGLILMVAAGYIYSNYCLHCLNNYRYYFHCLNYHIFLRWVYGYFEGSCRPCREVTFTESNLVCDYIGFAATDRWMVFFFFLNLEYQSMKNYVLRCFLVLSLFDVVMCIMQFIMSRLSVTQFY